MVEPQRVLTAIDKLNNIDSNDEYAYEKAFLAFLSIRSLPALVFKFQPGLELFRTRTHDDDILYKLIKDISMPAPHFVKNFARCNRSFQSKFYCSENRVTSYMELLNYWGELKSVDENLYATIGHWLFTAPVNTLIIVSPNNTDRLSKFHQDHGIAYDQLIQGHNEETIEGCRIFYDYMYNKFSKSAVDDPQLYIITSAYCNSVMAPNDAEIDAICYPSVPFGQQGINFAFDAKFIHPGNIQLLGALRNKFKVSLNIAGKKSFTQTEEIEAIGIDNPSEFIVWPAH